MGFFATRSRSLKPGRTRWWFLACGVIAFWGTEFGRFVYRPYARQQGIQDWGLPDSVGNLGGVIVQICLGIAVMNATRRQGYRLAWFFAIVYVVHEFAQPYLPRGTFDWKDVLATGIGLMIGLGLIWMVWRLVGKGESPDSSDVESPVDGP